MDTMVAEGALRTTIADDSNGGSSFQLYALENNRGRQRIRSAIGIVYVCAALAYLTWRTTVFNPDAPVFSLIFYIGEALGFILALFMIVISWRYRHRQYVAAPPDLKVDVFIPTYNEDPDMVRRTALAAVRLRYPHETWLLDDGNRAAIKAIADELGCHYIARAENTGAKPGNLNNALRHATGDYVAILDADNVAQPNMLDRVLGYFADPLVAFVQCPQSYYNITAFQYRPENHERYLWHDEGPFYDVLQPGRDYWNATSSCGTSVVYRRSMIDQIGGFAPETVTEDIHTAIRLHKHGFKSVYHPEPVAFGVAPNDLAEYQKTRHRWGQGNVQALRCERVPLSSGLTFMQRICYLHLGVIYLEGWQRLIFYLTPPFILMTGLYPVSMTPLLFWFFIPYILLDYLCFEETMRGYGRVYLNEQLCMSRFPIYVLSTFAVFFDYVRWRVSSKKINGTLPVQLLIPQIAVLILNLAGFAFGIDTIINDKLPVVPAGVTAFVCLFAVIYAVMAVLVIREAVKRAKYKRRDFRFDIPLPVRLEAAGGPSRYGLVSSISTTGMTLVVPGQDASAWRSPIEGQIYLPQGPVRFRASAEPAEDVAHAHGVRLRRGEIALLFDWRERSDKDRLDLTLHACGWHRRFAYPAGYLVTPIEWLQRMASWRSPVAPAEQWKYLLYRRRAPDGDGPLALAVLRTAGGREPSNRLVAFEPLAVGSDLVLVDPGRPDGAERNVVIAARGSAPNPSEAVIDGATMINYDFADEDAKRGVSRAGAAAILEAGSVA